MCTEVIGDRDKTESFWVLIAIKSMILLMTPHQRIYYAVPQLRMLYATRVLRKRRMTRLERLNTST